MDDVDDADDLNGTEALPPRVEVALDQSLGAYWKARERQHLRDVYAGVRIKKFPEDLRLMEHLMWLSRCQAVVELGTHFGGSALWFRDRLRALAAYGRVPGDVRVVTVDLVQDKARASLSGADPAYERDIALVEGDITDPATAERVRDALPPGARCLVVEDTLHTYATTTAALRHYAPMVPVGGFFLVEDGIVDVPELRPPGMPGGVQPAVRDWLASPAGSAFRGRRDLERYGLTCHPGGWLERVR
ncbi:CmcI family methyltransferase [Streptomyces sp. TRM64462]|uniref:CmcI family methyltransferase n=1 Tax=Streptomyces sp. TRM64462 TaxID=2741726 RepID=UPI00158602E0|nr:CmcI family methyltransferase [Streptomyces sp. TRM64462]